ncbi:hypothetical protein [Desulforhabdus amnigena]|uniref:Uncharacterized protein n=1 Tax=Desulforhabdus amnigena TaxID=40218 RepID=A0A9W6FUK5_9BACT|nr:hypothetical protein [Desulforhabdus amnigena]NLJ29536.1 hypothetical protein [Deltaproteobacteria bacterium]GLI35166.1 hypothetical protein DAMNIGENAA_25990 [Desulforhabdus amnigena]
MTATNNSPSDMLTALSEKYRMGDQPSPQEIEALLKLCRMPPGDMREAALSLLLHPPVCRELDYHRWLTYYLMDSNMRIDSLPDPLVELLLDRLAFLGRIPCEPRQKEFFVRLLRNLSPHSRELLFEKTFPLRPFLQYIPPKSLMKSLSEKLPRLFEKRGEMKVVRAGSPHHRNRHQPSRAQWRQLRKKLLTLPEFPPWSQVTLRDLKNMSRSARTGRRLFSLSKEAWLPKGRSLLFAASVRTQAPPLSPMSQIHWDGSSPETLRYFETLLACQAEELRRVRSLAQSVSQSTGRVVLSWHNATLGAAGGWAFESLPHYFSTDSVFESFKENVRSEMEIMEKHRFGGRDRIQDLWALWEKRMVKPKIMHALWESRIRATLDPSSEKGWKRDYQAAKTYLGEKDLSELTDGARLGWHGWVSPHQQVCVEEVVSWRDHREKLWKNGLLSLTALMKEGQKLMDAGRLGSFVLPWIDKFFISSKREQDDEYLPALVEWLESAGVQPLILFWEDTAHIQTPSFQLTLKKMIEKGHPYRGIGIFDTHGSERKKALEIINQEHSCVRLFALRPHSDTHHFRSLSELLRDKDPHFIEAYDSAWKDELCFIYTGTQVLPLLSVQCEMEPFPAWMASKGAKYPFGAYFRRRLRQSVLGEKAPAAEEDAFSTDYSTWANLL